MCKMLCVLRADFIKAKDLAEESFGIASSLTNSLTSEAIQLLQQLRDEYMTITNDTIPFLAANNSLCVANPEFAKSSYATTCLSPIKQLLENETGDVQILNQTNLSEFSPTKTIIIPSIQIIRRIRCNVSLDFPIRLEMIPYAGQIVPALDYIFRVYVRGNSLPGQQHGSKDVILGDNKLSLGKFLLQVSIICIPCII